MDKKVRLCILLIMFLVTSTLPGCWDKVEINERAFITAVGIDVYQPSKDEEKVKGELGMEAKDKYTITYVFPNIEAVGKGGQGQPRFIVASVGMTPYETTRGLRTRLHQVLFFQHMKVLVIGEDVAKDSTMLKEMLDSVERNNEINRKVNVLVAKGKAEDILNVQSQFEPDIGLYISSISEASEGSARFNPLPLGELLKSLHGNKRTLMPRVVPGKNDLKVAGSAVIKNYQLIGWLGELENRGAMFLKNKVKADTVVVIDYDNKVVIPYVITESETKQTGTIEDGKIKLKYDIKMEGDLSQYKMDTSEDVMDDKFLRGVEKQVEEAVKMQLDNTVKKIQKEFKVDVIDAGEYFSKYKPHIWNTVKDDWENIFPDIEIEVTVDSKIRRIGLIK
ncbi:Ger(x)C family spore germination protein [Sporosalibacterium faouarense]|uniref:Ger(x)C family spore germination protein n=1 Tax=Sporosalibacterium faouarense TaxID=516123 RepID=UPI00141C57BF|nr:Ger(x)C family spore germination protein [Sporosalibacterium faouarense]MTI48876.1 Ger(x)C family spore germination protein [Bacillota bacterium]